MLTARKEASTQMNGQCKGPKVRWYKTAPWLELSEPGAGDEVGEPTGSQRV